VLAVGVVRFMRILSQVRFFGNSLSFVLRSRVLVSVVNFSSNINNNYEMSSKNLPSWRQPEGHGELKIFNSLTREKVGQFPQTFSDAIS
jgi:hypothetical protein